MPNRELHNIIQIEDKDHNIENYNINAVHSDAASQVDHKLIIKQSKLTGADPNDVNGDGINYSDPDHDGKVFDDYNVEFDGHEGKEVCIVPSDGGCFTGPVAIGNLSEYNIERGTENSYIVNLGEIKHQLELLTGHPCWLWDGTKLEVITEGGLDESSAENTNLPTGEAPGDGQIGVFEAERFQTVSVLIGTYENFCKLIEDTNSEIRPEVFLYFCIGENDDGKTFFVHTEKNTEGNLICVCLQLSTSSLKIVSPTGVPEGERVSYTAQEIKDGFNAARNYTDTLENKLKGDSTADKLTVKDAVNATHLVNGDNPEQYFSYSDIDTIKTTHASDIEDIEDTLDSHSSGIQANSTQISTNTNNINSINTTIAQHTETIDNNSKAIQAADERITTLEADLAKNNLDLSSKIEDAEDRCKTYADSAATTAAENLKKTLASESRLRKIWLSSSAPTNSQGADGDVWIVYEN